MDKIVEVILEKFYKKKLSGEHKLALDKYSAIEFKFEGMLDREQLKKYFELDSAREYANIMKDIELVKFCRQLPFLRKEIL